MRRWGLVPLLGLLILGTPRSAVAQWEPDWEGKAAAPAEPAGPTIDRVAIEGNDRVEEEAIRVQIRSQAGGRLRRDYVDEDLRALYRTGFFDRVEADWSEGVTNVLTFRVRERPLVRSVKIEGTRKIKREDVDAALKIRPNTILDPSRIRRGFEEVRKIYEKKGYLDVELSWETDPLPGNEVGLRFRVAEGKVVRIREIHLEGAQAFPASKLRGFMQTRQKSWLSLITSAGTLDNEVLKTDVERLTAFYYDNGHIDVKVDQPKIERREDGLHVTIKIDEGEVYRVGSVDVAGDLLPNMGGVRSRLALATGDVFRTSKLREDINTVTEVYGDAGYAFVNVNPDTAVEAVDRTVDVTYRVSRGPEVTIDRILISGNTKTRDKVLRRELRLMEQERFSGSALKRSQERLKRLGYFEDVNITTRKSEGPDRLDLLIDVKEASTGSFSAGAGIASGENYLFNVRLSELNFRGRGQRVVLNADIGSIRRNFSFDFTEPYLFDTDITAGVNLFNWRLLFRDFTRGGTGAAFRLLYPLASLGIRPFTGYAFEDLRLGLEYRIESAEIRDVSAFAPAQIAAEEGSFLTSSITPRLFRDTRNHPFDPTGGSLQDVSLELAGLGGDSRFYKLEARTRAYVPIWRSDLLGTFVYSFGANFGYGRGYGERRELPLFERYFPGGINTIRGFRILSLGQRVPLFDQFGRLQSRTSIGGSQQLILNNEIIFPLVESLGLRGVAFFDAGNAFLASEGIRWDDMRLAAGGGIRWLSPVGPLRIEIGVPLNPRYGDDRQTVMFSFGGPP